MNNSCEGLWKVRKGEIKVDTSDSFREERASEAQPKNEFKLTKKRKNMTAECVCALSRSMKKYVCV